MSSSVVPRVYHSSVSLTPQVLTFFAALSVSPHHPIQGNFLVAGSNPNLNGTVKDAKFSAEYRVETLDPPYMFLNRPVLQRMPAKLAFDASFTVPISVPGSLKGKKIQREHGVS